MKSVVLIFFVLFMTKYRIMISQTDTTISKDIPDSASHSLSYIRDSKVTLNSNAYKGSIKNGISLKKIKTAFPMGNMSIGFDYGFLPFIINSTAPAMAIKSEGQVAMNLFTIPIDVTYFYTNQKNLVGLNNYFRISYNADRYKENLDKNLGKNATEYKSQLGPLMRNRQELLQKIKYNEYLLNSDISKWPASKVKHGSNPDTLLESSNNLQNTSPDLANHDTLHSDADQRKFVLSNNSAKPSNTLDSSVAEYKRDSVNQVYSDYRQKYDSVNRVIHEMQSKIEMIERFKGYGTSGAKPSYLPPDVPFLSKVQNFLRCVKKFDIGLCYPGGSGFLVSNIPVRGLNFEVSKNDLHLNFTYGTVVSTLLYSNRNIEGFIQSLRNSYTYFDFGNAMAGRKILSAKFGIGSKEGNHLFIGFLFGQGLSSYINLNSGEANHTSSKESNVVLELDVKYKLAKVTTLEIVTAKSSIKGEELSYEGIKSGFNEIFSSYRSNAVLTKLTTKINPTKTDLSFSIRWIDPFFKSYGTGFLRSDNMRYEIKFVQPITKSAKYTAIMRYEEDNLLRLLSYRNIFLSLNNNITCKIRRGLHVRLGYTSLFRTLNSINYSLVNNSSITTAVISYAPIFKKLTAQFNLLFNYYNIKADTLNLSFKNFAFTHQITFKSHFKTAFNLSWFKSSIRDTLPSNNIWMGVLDFGYSFKGGSSVSVGGKTAYRTNGALYPGFLVKTNIKVLNGFFWEASIEKFIVGDLFNGYDLQNLKHFPYLFSTKITYNF